MSKHHKHHHKDLNTETQRVVVLKKNNEEEKGQNIIQTKNDIAWKAPEYEFREKEVSWYWISLIAGIILVAIALWQRNFLFAIFIVIAEITIFYLAGRIPKIWDFKITDKGVVIGETKTYLFENIENFDIHPFSEDFSHLLIKFRSGFRPILKIFIHPEDEEIISKKLLQFIERQEMDASLIDELERIMRF